LDGYPREILIVIEGEINSHFAQGALFQKTKIRDRRRCEPLDSLRFMTGGLAFDPNPSIELRTLSLSKGSGRGARPACR